MAARFSTLIHTFSLALAIMAVYWWLHVPQLQPYSLQAFAGVGLLYFLVKAIGKSKAWHVLPRSMSVETSLATMAFLLLIGATGNTASWFYPLAYIHLFFIVFSSEVITSIVVTLLIVLFHFGISPELAQHELVSLATLPIIMAFFLFAKFQHAEVVRDRQIIREDEEKLHSLESEEFQVENFLEFYLKNELEKMAELGEQTNSVNLLLAKVEQIKQQLEELLGRIKN